MYFAPEQYYLRVVAYLKDRAAASNRGTALRAGFVEGGGKATKDQTLSGQQRGMMMSVVCRGVGNLPRWPCTVQSITHDYDAGPRGATARHSTSRVWHLGQCACTMQPSPALACHGISATSPYCVKYLLPTILKYFNALYRTDGLGRIKGPH